MWTELYKQVMIMSASAGGIYLFLKASSVLTQRYFTATWHYYTYLLVFSLFIIPCYKLIPLFDLNFSSGQGDIKPELLIGIGESVSQIAGIPVFSNVEHQPSSLSLAFSIADDYLPYILMSGTLIFWGVILLQNFKLNRLISTLCELTTDAQVLDALSQCKKKLNMTKEIPVYISPYISSPFLYGAFKPRIIMPSLDFNKEEYHHIFLHELTHYQRLDVWVKVFMIMIHSLHWFNPLAYMVRRDIDQYCEMSCDESIVKVMNRNERKRYCELLLNVLWHAADQKTKLYSAFGDKQRNMERRVHMIMRTDGIRRNKWIRMTAIFVTLSFAIADSIAAYAVNASNTKDDSPASENHVSEHEIITESEFARMMKIIQDVNAGILPESALEETQPLLERDPKYRTARSKENPPPAEQAFEAPASAVEAGGIETKDGKNLSIWLIGGAKNNFGELPFQKGETFTLSVISEEERALEIGIMSITTEQVYSELVNTGTGTVSITIPEDGNYRIYVSNKASDAAEFELKLSKAIEGPIV